jgi:protease I
MAALSGKKVLIFVGDIYEDMELWYPKIRLTEAGAEVVTAGLQAGATYKGKHGYPCTADAALSEVKADDFDGLVIPGGYMPDKLRTNEHVKKLTRDFAASGKLVAAICHAAWIPISAGILEGRQLTSYSAIADDVKNAGGKWSDAEVIVDGNLITSRHPGDLPAFLRAIIDFLK